MKKIEKAIGKMAKGLATKSVIANANSTTSIFTYQPSVPKNLKNLKK